MEGQFTPDRIKTLLASPIPKVRFCGRQMMFNEIPLSYFIENYLIDNEHRKQNLSMFPMFKQVYNNLPQRLLMKCSRKTLKSTFLSNLMCYNMIKCDDYNQMYVGNLEKTAKLFSKSYFMPRFDSPLIKEILNPRLWKTDDVFEKVLTDTNSSTIFRYCSEDATRCRGPSTHENLIDEIQDINYDELAIINETLTVLKSKRIRYAGTPLSTSNTIHRLWLKTNRCEWMTRCGCGHWNHLTEENDPLKMLLEQGYSCSKCSKLLNTMQGEWVARNPAIKDFHGIHLAQPMLPYYNQDPLQWADIFRKISKMDEMPLFNEVLGLAYNSATTRPITPEELQNACVLGPMYEEGSTTDLRILNKGRREYILHANGTDWGVNQKTSRTVTVQGGLKSNGIFEIYWMKNFKNFDYASHIREIASNVNAVNAKVACDGGPDPARGIALTELVGGPSNCQLVRYEHGKTIQRYDWDPGSDWRTARWVLHRSDVLGWCFRMIKAGKIRFARWSDTSEYLQDLINVFLEIREGQLRQEQFYRHLEDEPDDFLHAIAFAAATAFCAAGDSSLTGASSSSANEAPATQ